MKIVDASKNEVELSRLRNVKRYVECEIEKMPELLDDLILKHYGWLARLQGNLRDVEKKIERLEVEKE